MNWDRDTQERLEELLVRVTDGAMTAADYAELDQLLNGRPEARELYLEHCQLQAQLLEQQGAFGASECRPAAVTKPTKQFPVWAAVAAAAVFVIGIALRPQQPAATTSQQQVANPVIEPLVVTASIAEVVSMTDARWMSPEASYAIGDQLRVGQRLELHAGLVSVTFASGAQMDLHGPAIVAPLSAMSARLVLGEVKVRAETASAKGFTVITPNSEFVDIGTEFTASVAPDGLSKLQVTEGDVDVKVKGSTQARRIRAGQTLLVEPGKRPVFTQIEPGDGTTLFEFPTIGPPSAMDYADLSSGRVTIKVARGKLRDHHGPSGPPTVLLDGVGQSHQDSWLESAFFETGTTGAFLMDLGKAVPVRTVNAYSWHQNPTMPGNRYRARHKYTLYGFAGDEPPAVDEPEETGWTRIARVNTDVFFRVKSELDRPAQQVSSITATDGDLGRYRYLLWDVGSPTFFGEFDVFVDDTPQPTNAPQFP